MPGFAYETVATRVVRQARDAYRRFRSGRLPAELEAAFLRAGITPPDFSANKKVIDLGERAPLIERLIRGLIFGLAISLFFLSLGTLTAFLAQLLASYVLLTRTLGIKVTA